MLSAWTPAARKPNNDTTPTSALTVRHSCWAHRSAAPRRRRAGSRAPAASPWTPARRAQRRCQAGWEQQECEVAAGCVRCVHGWEGARQVLAAQANRQAWGPLSGRQHSAAGKRVSCDITSRAHRVLCMRTRSRLATFCSVRGSWKRMAASGSSCSTLTTAERGAGEGALAGAD